MGSIKFTLKTESQNRTFRFSKDVIIFGEGDPEKNDVLITDIGLSEEHFKIVNQSGKFVAINAANDPFITLNGFPFGKKTLKVGDIVHLRDVEVTIDAFNEEEVSAIEPIPVETVSQQEAHVEAKHTTPAFEDLSTLGIESFLGDVHEEPELVFKPPTPTANVKAKEQSTKEGLGWLSLKDDPYQENEEEQKPQQPPQKLPSTTNGWKMQWKYLAWGVTLLFVISGLIASEMYLRFTNMSEDEEMLAAEGVADIAMALTYAKLHAVNPASQNWSDPEFLRHSLLAILSPSTIASTGIMNSSQGSNSHYILRIYTSYDLSRFLVVAQPTPNLMQMWVPKHAIIVDSRMMYLRKTMDFKALNRFLAYPYPLDESHSAELDQLISNSKLIPLSDIAEIRENLEFMPPKALGFLRPGAENRIYNAPRYHEFGEAVLMHTLTRQDLSNIVDDDWNVHDELEKLASLDNFVLYVPEKITLSPHASDLFSALPLEGKFLLGYLNLTNDGKIRSSHLMMQNDPVWTRDVEEEVEPQKDIALSLEEVQKEKTPIQQELSKLAQIRLGALKEQRAKINTEIDRHLQDNSSDCLQNACNALKEYDNLAMKHSLMIREELHKLREQYKEIPQDEFEKDINEAGLGIFLEAHAHKKIGDESHG